MKNLLRRLLFHRRADSSIVHFRRGQTAESKGTDPIVGKWKNVRSGCVMILSADGKAYEYKVNFKMHGNGSAPTTKG